ncbi:MAG: CapA family protein, partial [Clostridiales bacterium]|nr:CapA family protein [Clostridiales bacterium]
AIELYQAVYPSYDIIERDTPKPLYKIAEPRFALVNGVYTNWERSDTAVLMFTGDLMCQGRQQEAAYKDGAYDFNDSLSIVKDVFSQADLVVGNLETMLDSSAPYMGEMNNVDGKPFCNAPATYLDALKFAGFDLLVNANNHSGDTGVKGIFETNSHLDRYGFMHTGLFTSENEQRFLIIDVNGIKIAVMAYATWYNAKDFYFTDAGLEILLNKYSKERVEADVENAKAMGTQFIIAYNHWGREHTNEVVERQERYAQEMADAGVDYIMGSHPHALQKYDVLTASDGRSVPVVYSLGNFVSHMKKTVNKDTVILRLQLKNENGKIVIDEEGYIPCRVFETFLGKDYLVLPAVEKYSGGHSSKYFEPAKTRIMNVMGDKISCIE